MKRLLLACLFAIPFWGFSQITLNQKDDFEDFTTANWTKPIGSLLPNQNISTGGPDGENDNFLKVQSNFNGEIQDYFLMTYNNAQWTGSYTNAGVTYISMDVRNSGENVIILRLSFLSNFDNGASYWSSITPIAVLPGEDWKTIVFPIDENSLVMTDGWDVYSYSESFSDIVELRILHNDAPAWEADIIEATLDIDNIQARDSNMEVIDLADLKDKIKVYPNPSSNFVKVEGLTSETGFKIFNTSGTLVKSGKTKNSENIDIQNFPKGIYLLKLDSGKTLKFIKE